LFSEKKTLIHEHYRHLNGLTRYANEAMEKINSKDKR